MSSTEGRLVIRREVETEEDQDVTWFNDAYRANVPSKKSDVERLVKEYLGRKGVDKGTIKVTTESGDRKVTSVAPTKEQLEKVLADLGDIFEPTCCNRKINIALWGLIVVILGLVVKVVSLVLDCTTINK
eukprot:TRINITY_DN1450_c0_g1_i4.p2 TRINITY_DN1450_c0_g1~~TRINITY_DN1450_c0_g1_i4.p2  ORF type:complete len:130 (+),score=7.79 TRINITY_DN1450_c0_g1_i4:706-1095(+)